MQSNKPDELTRWMVDVSYYRIYEWELLYILQETDAQHIEWAAVDVD